MLRSIHSVYIAVICEKSIHSATGRARGREDINTVAVMCIEYVAKIAQSV